MPEPDAEQRAEAPYSVASGQIVRGDKFVGAVEAVARLNAAEAELAEAREAERQALVAHAYEKQQKHAKEAELAELRARPKVAEWAAATNLERAERAEARAENSGESWRLEVARRMSAEARVKRLEKMLDAAEDYMTGEMAAAFRAAIPEPRKDT